MNQIQMGPPRRRRPILRYLILILLVGLGLWLIPPALDRTPPVLTVEGLQPGGRYGGVLEITIRGEDAGRGLERATITQDGTFIAEIPLTGKQAEVTYAWDTKLVPDGVSLIEITLTDASLWHKYDQGSFDLIVDNTPPELTLQSTPSEATQGQAVAFFVAGNETLKTATGTLLDRPVEFHALGARLRGLVGIPHNAAAGTHQVEVHATDLAGNKSVVQSQLRLRKGSFKTGVVNLPRKKTALLTDQSKKQVNREKRAQALQTANFVQLWKGTFQKPTQGVTTSTFGARRVYNNGVVRSVHTGWDIANREGTHVVAANYGVVVLAEELPLHGNNIIVDHGQGVFSGYAHLSEILVEVGADVQKGDLIGRMGTTGQSTGSHLHWDMFVGGVTVDPVQWLSQDFSR